MTFLWLVPALPLLGFVLLSLFQRLTRRAATAIGVGSVGLSMLAAFWAAYQFIVTPPAGGAFSQTLWSWMEVGGFSAGISFYLDSFSLVMIVVITFVAFFIHIYSTSYMAGDDGNARFFAYMNLFVSSMLILVLAGNLLLLFLGGAGGGLCSYLLIGFWYKDPANARAAIKAFVVTRVGDAAMLIGMLLLFVNLGTLDIQELLKRAVTQWAPGSTLPVVAAILILGGAVGKSAQLPLQTWLPDAMAGPTPVSALIHAATMVTAGVYLIARTREIFQLAPVVQTIVVVVGLATLLLAGASAITQRDIKRVIAYSTMSQIGYMFLALGLGAWAAGILHFVTHAFFKSLLFLAAGIVIVRMNHEQDLFKMGGLRKHVPVAFWTFLIGSLSMTAVPPLIAGFDSKDWILYWAWSSPNGGPLVWGLALFGAFLTGCYSFRLIFLAFGGAERAVPEHGHKIGAALTVTVIVLAVPAALIGLVQTPDLFFGINLFSQFVGQVLPMPAGGAPPSVEIDLLLASQVVGLLGILVGWLLARSQAKAYLAAPEKRPSLVHRYLFSGWGFDWLYDRLLVRPVFWFTRINRDDAVDWIPRGLAFLSSLLHRLLSRTQNGRLRWYATALGAGAVIIVALVVFI